MYFTVEVNHLIAQTLRGKTIECISLIGLAVGKDMFKEDAITIMTLLSNTMSELAPDDPQCSYMISSWTRICKVRSSMSIYLKHLKEKNYRYCLSSSRFYMKTYCIVHICFG